MIGAVLRERRQECLAVVEPPAHLELDSQDVVEIKPAQVRIVDRDEDGGHVIDLDQSLDERGLAGADVPREKHAAVALQDPLLEGHEGLGVFLAEPQEGRVGADVERFFFQLEMGEIHSLRKLLPGMSILVRHRPAHCLGNGSFTPGGSLAENGEPPFLPLGGDFGGRTPLGRSSPSNSIMSETLL